MRSAAGDMWFLSPATQRGRLKWTDYGSHERQHNSRVTLEPYGEKKTAVLSRGGTASQNWSLQLFSSENTRNGFGGGTITTLTRSDQFCCIYNLPRPFSYFFVFWVIFCFRPHIIRLSNACDMNHGAEESSPLSRHPAWGPQVCDDKHKLLFLIFPPSFTSFFIWWGELFFLTSIKR